MAADPRDALQDLLAENEGARRNGRASDGRGWYRTDAEREECYAIADTVLHLFPDVSVDGPPPFRFLLRSAPVAQEDTDA